MVKIVLVIILWVLWLFWAGEHPSDSLWNKIESLQVYPDTKHILFGMALLGFFIILFTP